MMSRKMVKAKEMEPRWFSDSPNLSSLEQLYEVGKLFFR
jgi:hypothetical protein